MKVKRTIKNVLTARQNKIYDKRLAKIQVSYDEWIKLQESKCKAHYTKASENAELVYIFSSYGHGFPAEDLKTICGNYFFNNPDILLAYGDEDVQSVRLPDTRVQRHSPWFKPAWSPDLFDCSFYFGSLTVMRRGLFDRAEKICGGDFLKKTGFTINGRGDELYIDVLDGQGELKLSFLKFMRICVELAGGYTAGAKTIGHINYILFHCSDKARSEIFIPNERVKRSLYEVRSNDFKPAVSIIIPSKDNVEVLSKCIDGIRGSIIRPVQFEIIIVDNGSAEENKRRLESMSEQLRREKISVRYIYERAEFNFSHMCNLGASEAYGDYLLFLNDDVELCAEDCICRMAEMADRNYTGAVGIKLYYPDSDIIQHAGITNLPMGPVHKLQFLKDNTCYYYGSNRGKRNVIAVTAACLMVEKKKFNLVGGFSEELRVAFNDVDLCLSLFEKGYYNVCLNDCHAYHHESLSRGDDETEEKLNRLLTERDKLYAGHPGLEGIDPFYPLGLSRDWLDTGMRAMYETSGTFIQECEVSRRLKRLDGYRHDACLLLRVEWSRKGVIQGYGVVLGDNNACYERELLLADMSDEKKIYAVKLKEQYRPELVENMPDQINVGLCGFKVKLKGSVLEGSCFRIGMAVRSRVNGTGIYYFSNRQFEAD